MKRESTFDISIIISCIAGIIISYVYLQSSIERLISFFIFGVLCLFFSILLIVDSMKNKKERSCCMEKGISEIVLFGEDNNITDMWDIYGKTSIVFGKDEGENQVDVNLKNTDYAGTVDGEHAVMNYSNGSWYIEDLDSENGTRIQREGSERKYKVSSREPCKIEKGDIIYIGLAPIRIQ